MFGRIRSEFKCLKEIRSEFQCLKAIRSEFQCLEEIKSEFQCLVGSGHNPNVWEKNVKIPVKKSLIE